MKRRDVITGGIGSVLVLSIPVQGKKDKKSKGKSKNANKRKKNRDIKFEKRLKDIKIDRGEEHSKKKSH
ncbi:hypothetical protein ACOZ4I_18345 (plasmid) [Haloarcula salina]|uniref:hypothetical protein n=1 Tax=Haloarcula salina TaxID=1429914 RepID=UPI003C703F7D